MKYTVLLFLFSASLFSQTAPNIEWAKCFGGPSNEVLTKVLQTADGGFIMAGSTFSTNGDITNNHGLQDWWVVKTGPLGNLEWQKCYGGSFGDGMFQTEVVNSIQQTSDGGYILAGQTASSDGNVLGYHGGVDAWVIKIDNNGNLVWQKAFGGSGQDIANAITTTTDGNYIFTGTAESNNGNLTGVSNGAVWIVKIDSNGNIIWQKRYGTALIVIYDIKRTNDGGYITAGMYSLSSVDPNYNGNDFYVSKLDAVGNVVWQNTFGDRSTDIAFSVQQTTDGGYVAAGMGTIVLGNSGNPYYWVIKMNNTGAIEWEKHIGGQDNSLQVAKSIRQTFDGGYIVAGQTASLGGDISNPIGGGNFDYWIIKLNGNGNIVWEKSLGGTGTDSATSIQQTTDGGFIVGGNSDSSNVNVINNHGNNDFWIVKLAPEANLNFNDFSHKEIKIYPNPVTNIVNIDNVASYNVKNIMLTDLTGKVLKVEQNTIKLDISNYPKGFYLLSVEHQNGERIVLKLLKK
jgi:hypothetical protein